MIRARGLVDITERKRLEEQLRQRGLHENKHTVRVGRVVIVGFLRQVEPEVPRPASSSSSISRRVRSSSLSRGIGLVPRKWLAREASLR